jgi:glycosyltransferase involved in cell wall biosynthesis
VTPSNYQPAINISPVTELDRPIHLLWLSENYHPNRGGMAHSCDRIVHALREIGVTVDLVHFTRHVTAIAVERNAGGRYIAFPPGEDPAHGMNLLWTFLENDPLRAELTHVVAFGGLLPLLSGPLFAAWLGLPLVTLFRGNDFDAAIFSPKRSDIVHRAIEQARHVCVVTREKERKIRAIHPGTEIAWIPNGIDLESWTPSASDRRRAAEWRASHVKPEKRTLGLFGQIKLKKGGLFFLDALLRSGYAGRFHILFVGELGEEVVAWLETNGAEIDHTLLPFIDRFDLIPYYLASDMIVIPSFYDGMPNVLLEGAALARPMLASTAGGMGDLLEDNRHGYLFPPGDVDRLVGAIARAADASDEELARLGAECRAVVSGLDHHTEAAAYRDLFIRSLPMHRVPSNGSGSIIEQRS